MSNHCPIDRIQGPYQSERFPHAIAAASDDPSIAGLRWQSAATRTLLHELPAKLIFGGTVGTICTVMFQALQRFGPRTAEMRTDCMSWHFIAFDDRWTWPYLSMMPFIGLAWLFLPTAREARRFSAYFLGMATIGWLIFFFHPTGCVRPHIESPSWIYRMLVLIDGPTNGLPCLHVSMSILAGTALAMKDRAFETMPGRLFVIAWVMLITVSVVALHQHTDADTMVGSVLGGTVALLYSRRMPDSGVGERPIAAHKSALDPETLAVVSKEPE